ncbi:hypothetical protein AVEN_236729-1 [Araneus ventricosus]|uniref:Reverse transcriptase domain-containing protein n=1 Tax=Araneus ventricosus TaxID=182803 RepID=A0A4Y2QJ88_ARAVE|nr:hypothetical protein AVEN_236729-1 [Araneus ventricosus]
MKRLETSTRKLHHENLFTAYDDVFKEWAPLGIIENDPVESASLHHEHYLPHRPVVKQHRTTKVHPVFDASARQIGKENADQKITRYAGVVFGVKSSPFLLEAVLEHHLKKYLKSSTYSKRTVDILRSFYVDELITTLDNKTEILHFIKECYHILAEGKFNLRGWKYTGDDDTEQVTSVLGLIWNRRQDELKINLDWMGAYEFEILSKRVILSVTHRIFYPVGFLCHVLLIPKLMLQKMRKDNIPWDREVEDNMKLEFLKWFEELGSLKNLTVSRCFYPASSRQYGSSVHTFCNASQFAYAAAVFVRIESSDVVQVNILAAKSRVAQLKSSLFLVLSYWLQRWEQDGADLCSAHSSGTMSRDTTGLIPPLC